MTAPALHSEPGVPRAQLVLAEQVATLYRNLPLVLAGNVLMAPLLAAALPATVPLGTRIAWVAAVWLQTAVRAGLLAAYQRAAPRPADARRWSRYATWGSLAGGLAWGAAGIVLYVPDQLLYQLLLLFVLIGMGSSAVYALTPHLPTFHAFLLPSIAPTFVVQARGDTPGDWILAGMTLVYVGVTLFFARNLHRVLEESLHLRFENIELMEGLRRQKEEAERANLAKSRFLAAASHDLRQPIHALALFTDILRERVAGQPDALAVADRIGDSIAAMSGLFNALLDVSRLDAGVTPRRIVHFPVARVLRNAENVFTPLALERGLRFKVVHSAAVIESDPMLLDRIVQNLVANAVKYTRDGGVLVGCRRRSGRLSIEVLDTGPGIPESERENVFQEFFQLGNPGRDRGKGLGLGLAIVDRISRLLDHPIALRSAVGRGSCFAVSVPRGDRTLAAEATRVEGAGGASLDGTCVVCIDDEAAVLDGMTALLELWGCRVLPARSGDEALERLAAAGVTPDLVISDYRLADENGIDVVKRLQTRLGGEVPALLVTGDTAPDRVKEANASGFALLYKPVQPARLRQLVHDLTARTRQPAISPG